jgi:hypothetical protein
LDKAGANRNPAEKQDDWRARSTLITVRLPFCDELGLFPRYYSAVRIKPELTLGTCLKAERRRYEP